MKDKGWLFIGDTLIRSVLHLDPDTLSDEQWAWQVRMAEWAQYNYFRKLGELLGG